MSQLSPLNSGMFSRGIPIANGRNLAVSLHPTFSFLDNERTSSPNQAESPTHQSANNSFSFLFKDTNSNHSSSNDLPTFMKSFLNCSQNDKTETGNVINEEESAIGQSSVFRSSIQDEAASNPQGGTSTGKRSNQESSSGENNANDTTCSTHQPSQSMTGSASNGQDNPSQQGPPSKKLKTTTLNAHSSESTSAPLTVQQANPSTQKQPPFVRNEGNVLPFSTQKFSLNAAQRQQSGDQVSTPKKNTAERNSPSSQNNSSTPSRSSLSAMSPPPNKPNASARTGHTSSKTSLASLDQSPLKTPSPSQPSKPNQVPGASNAQDNLNLSFERTEKIVSKHRTELDDLKLVENQLNGVKRKDSEMTKTMEDLHAKMLEHSDTLRALSLKISILTNKLLLADSPAFRESIDKLHLKYADLLNHNP
ncbi:hypothetical protein FDP41_008222 [Naegleria fowleri]|uniref:Uncharacterized protein n=1 Tax=Naegleria fowleri TaxID=5763 RepID=A0A6A5BHK5_NAEFO|nr:uncharacterized protein FDP41_008222 [Naegleria fowleri]KAF0973518.1 hypothetical protein FDP41_008222 [Naegleria fowleri]